MENKQFENKLIPLNASIPDLLKQLKSAVEENEQQANSALGIIRTNVPLPIDLSIATKDTINEMTNNRLDGIRRDKEVLAKIQPKENVIKEQREIIRSKDNSFLEVGDRLSLLETKISFLEDQERRFNLSLTDEKERHKEKMELGKQITIYENDIVELNILRKTTSALEFKIIEQKRDIDVLIKHRDVLQNNLDQEREKLANQVNTLAIKLDNPITIKVISFVLGFSLIGIIKTTSLVRSFLKRISE